MIRHKIIKNFETEKIELMELKALEKLKYTLTVAHMKNIIAKN